jgi:hypothetical protein
MKAAASGSCGVHPLVAPLKELYPPQRISLGAHQHLLERADYRAQNIRTGPLELLVHLAGHVDTGCSGVPLALNILVPMHWGADLVQALVCSSKPHDSTLGN